MPGTLRLTHARFLAVMVLVFVTASCAKDVPKSLTTPTSQSPGAVTMAVDVGLGESAQTATLHATVRDANFNHVAGVAVIFSSDRGTIDPATTTTDDKGVATSVLSADPGSVNVTATVSALGLKTTTLVAVQAKPTPPPTPGPPPPAPPPPTFPPPTPGRPDYTVGLNASPNPILINTATTLTATVTVPLRAPAPATFSWDCGNGTTTTTATSTTTCTYTTAGSNTAKVTVTGGSGASTTFGSAATVVTVTGPPVPPVPEVTVNCGQPTPPVLTLNCNVQAKLNGVQVNSNDITHVDFDWGDHTPITSVNNSNQDSHLYGAANTYTIVASNVTVNGTTAKGSGSTLKAVAQ